MESYQSKKAQVVGAEAAAASSRQSLSSRAQ